MGSAFDLPTQVTIKRIYIVSKAAKERVTTAYTWVPSKSKSLAS